MNVVKDIAIENEALKLWARTNAKNTIKNNKKLIGKSFYLEKIKDSVCITKNTFKKNLRYEYRFIKRNVILNNFEKVIHDLKYNDFKKVKEKNTQKSNTRRKQIII